MTYFSYCNYLKKNKKRLSVVVKFLQVFFFFWRKSQTYFLCMKSLKKKNLETATISWCIILLIVSFVSHCLILSHAYKLTALKSDFDGEREALLAQLRKLTEHPLINSETQTGNELLSEVISLTSSASDGSEEVWGLL